MIHVYMPHNIQYKHIDQSSIMSIPVGSWVLGQLHTKTEVTLV